METNYMEHEIIDYEHAGLWSAKGGATVAKVHEREHVQQEHLGHLEVLVVLEDDEAVGGSSQEEIAVVFKNSWLLLKLERELEPGSFIFGLASLKYDTWVLFLVINQGEDSGAKNKAKVPKKDWKSLWKGSFIYLEQTEVARD